MISVCDQENIFTIVVWGNTNPIVREKIMTGCGRESTVRYHCHGGFYWELHGRCLQQTTEVLQSLQNIWNLSLFPCVFSCLWSLIQNIDENYLLCHFFSIYSSSTECRIFFQEFGAILSSPKNFLTSSDAPVIPSGLMLVKFHSFISLPGHLYLPKHFHCNLFNIIPNS